MDCAGDAPGRHGRHRRARSPTRFRMASRAAGATPRQAGGRASEATSCATQVEHPRGGLAAPPIASRRPPLGARLPVRLEVHRRVLEVRRQVRLQALRQVREAPLPSPGILSPTQPGPAKLMPHEAHRRVHGARREPPLGARLPKTRNTKPYSTGHTQSGAARSTPPVGANPRSTPPSSTAPRRSSSRLRPRRHRSNEPPPVSRRELADIYRAALAEVSGKKKKGK